MSQSSQNSLLSTATSTRSNIIAGKTHTLKTPWGKALPHQNTVVNKLLRCKKQHGILVMHGAGTGKTETSLLIALNMDWMRKKIIVRKLKSLRTIYLPSKRLSCLHYPGFYSH